MSYTNWLTCFLLIVPFTRTFGAEESPLVWKFQVGDEYHYRMTQNMDMEMSMGAADRKSETSMHQVMDMTWKVTNIDDQGVASISQLVNRVSMDMRAPGQPELHYDTDADEAAAGFAVMVDPLFKAMTAEPFELRITPRGEIKDLKIPQAFAAALKKIPGAAMMGEMFSDEGFKNMMQQSSLVLPEPKDLKPGHEWTRESKIENAQIGELTTKSTYRYLGSKEVKGKPFEVFGVTMETEFGAMPEGLQMEVARQDSQGEIFFDREAGSLESSNLKQDMETNISMAGQEMSQKMVQTMMFERVEQKSSEE